MDWNNLIHRKRSPFPTGEGQCGIALRWIGAGGLSRVGEAFRLPRDGNPSPTVRNDIKVEGFMEYSYVVTGPGGNVVLQAAAGCRYPKETERDLLENGYQIRLDGRKLTKKELRCSN